LEYLLIRLHSISEGAISDISFVHRVKDINEDLSVVPADLLFDNSSGHRLLETLKADGESQIIYHIPEHGDDPRIHRISVATNSDLLAKEDAADAKKLLICPLAFVIRQDRLSSLEPYLRKLHQERKRSNSGENTVVSLERDLFSFYEQEENVKTVEVDYVAAYGYLNPRVTLNEYLEKWEKLLDGNIPPRSPENHPHHQTDPIVTRSHARVGLMGNPSDGFYGKIKNRSRKRLESPTFTFG
jgi:glucuronokinase